MASATRRPRLVAFLRGMNLGGRRITNDALAAHFERAGFVGVAPYQASGNVVFELPAKSTADGAPEQSAALEARIEAHLRDALGYDAPTFIRTIDQLRGIAALEEPMAAEADGFKVHVLFLKHEPPPGLTAELQRLETDDDQLRVADRHVLWFRRGRLKESTIDFGDTDALTGGVPSTMRTLGTVRRIVKKFG